MTGPFIPSINGRIRRLSAVCLGCVWMLLILHSAQSQSAARDSVARWGIGSHFRWLDPRSTIAAFPSIPTCCSLLDAQGGWAYGASAVREIIPRDRFGLEGSIGVTSSSINLASGSFVGYALEGTGPDARVVRAESLTEVDLHATTVETSITATWSPRSIPSFVHLYASFRSNWNLAVSLRQTERLLSPASSVFSDTREQTRLNFDLPVTDRMRHLHLLGVGAGGETSLSSSVAVNARLGLEIPLNGMLQEGIGTILAGRLRLDLIVFFKEQSVMTTPDTVTQAPPDPPKNADPNCMVRLDSVVGNVTWNTRQRIFSLLPYVFFDKGSSLVTGQRYNVVDTSAAVGFDERRMISSSADSLSEITNTLNLYYNVLNIVGRRMRDDFPRAILRVSGYTDDAEVESNNVALARRRAIEVAKYLHTVWRIDSTRLIITAGRLSPTAAITTMLSEQDRLDGHQENRRVELQSSIAEVLDPVVVRDTTLLRSSLQAWGITEALVADSGYRVLFYAGNDSYLHLCTSETVGQTGPMKFTTELSGMCGTSSRQPTYVKAIIESPLTQNTPCVDSCVVTIRKTYQSAHRDALGTEIDRFRLTQFQYDAGEPLEAQKSLIERYILPSVRPSSSIELLGFTDRKGPADANQRLSEQRAEMLTRLLRDRSSVSLRAYGEGSTNASAPFPNDTPEGRLYNRTVEVIIRTPSVSP
jgi:outer membrane protein OmpA-like peptidoglycan-associated protein